MCQSIQLVFWDLHGGLRLREQRNNGLARVSTNDGNDSLAGVLLASERLHESLGTNNVERGDTKELLGVEYASLLQHLGSNRHSAVHWVGDDEDKSIGAVLGDALDQTLDDTGVDLEEIVTGHTGLACQSVTVSAAAAKSFHSPLLSPLSLPLSPTQLAHWRRHITLHWRRQKSSPTPYCTSSYPTSRLFPCARVEALVCV